MVQFGRMLTLAVLMGMLTSFALTKGFVIKGQIQGVDDGTWVKLYDLDKQTFLDSTQIKNGSFVLKGWVEYPTTCWIRCKESYSIIQVENVEMTFKGPITNLLLNSQIQGGREQALQNQLSALQQPYDLIYYAALDSLMNNRYSTEETKQKLIKRYNESQGMSHQIYVDFGKRHPDSFLGLNIMYMNRGRIPVDTLRRIHENLTPAFKNTPKANAIRIVLYEKLARKGEHFIDFQVKTLAGIDFSLSSLKGKYIYLSFWSAGCSPCRMENRALALHKAELPEHLALVNFSIDKNVKAWASASKADGISWYNVSDLAGDNGKIKTIYQVQAIPTSFLIDKEGTIIEQFTGFDTDMIGKLNSLIEAKERER